MSQLLAKNQEKVNILVAKAKIARWTPIRKLDDFFEPAEVLVTEVPKDVVTVEKAQDVINRMLIKNLDKGDKLTFDALQTRDKGGLEAELAPGKRAMAVRIAAETSAGGFVLPGSRVDVLHSVREGNRGSDAKVILENILVKAIDLLPVRPEDRPGMVGGTATLEVTPQEALKLASVQNNGMLMLVLRPYGDTSKTPEPEVDVSAITPPPAPPEAKKPEKTEVAVAAPKAPEDKVAHVTIISSSGILRQRYHLNKDGEVAWSESLDSPVPAPRLATEPKSDKASTEEVKKVASKDEVEQ
jgi:pilus assembly protein CpaB